MRSRLEGAHRAAGERFGDDGGRNEQTLQCLRVYSKRERRSCRAEDEAWLKSEAIFFPLLPYPGLESIVEWNVDELLVGNKMAPPPDSVILSTPDLPLSPNTPQHKFNRLSIVPALERIEVYPLPSIVCV